MKFVEITKEVTYTSVEEANDTIVFNAISTVKNKVCPYCGQTSTSMHSKFKRNVQDLPLNGKTAYISIENKIMRCRNTECEYNTFSEEFSFAPIKAKYTKRLEEHILSVARTTSNRKACQILQGEGIKIEKSAVQRLLAKNGH